MVARAEEDYSDLALPPSEEDYSDLALAPSHEKQYPDQASMGTWPKIQRAAGIVGQDISNIPAAIGNIASRAAEAATASPPQLQA